MNYQRNCKICNAPNWLREGFVIMLHVEHKTYREICEEWALYGYVINGYNCSTHRHRHLTIEDYMEAEATKVLWNIMDAEVAAERSGSASFEKPD